MATIRRLAHSCLTVTTAEGTALLDPGFFSFDEQPVDLDDLGEVQRVLVTHEHGDHVKPEFVRWLVDRGEDVTVHANQEVVDLLAQHDLRASTEAPAGAAIEDVEHETLPDGSTVPNRSWTVGETLTHPGDSYGPTRSASVLALPLMTPWGSATASVQFAQRLGVEQVVPVHDLYLSDMGRQFQTGIVSGALEQAGIELLRLDWGDSATV